MHPPPHPCTLYPPLAQRNQLIGRHSGMPPLPGGAATLAVFLSGSPGHATLCKPHKHDDAFPLCRIKLPSLTYNLVERRLRLAKRAADTLPASVCASTYCCLPRQLNCREPQSPILLGRATATRRNMPRGRPSACLLGRDGGGLALLAATSLSAAAGVQQGGTTTMTISCPASIRGGLLGRRRRRLGGGRRRRRRDDCCRR